MPATGCPSTREVVGLWPGQCDRAYTLTEFFAARTLPRMGKARSATACCCRLTPITGVLENDAELESQAVVPGTEMAAPSAARFKVSEFFTSVLTKKGPKTADFGCLPANRCQHTLHS